MPGLGKSYHPVTAIRAKSLYIDCCHSSAEVPQFVLPQEFGVPEPLVICKGLRSSLRENGEKEDIYPFVHLQQNKIAACQAILKKNVGEKIAYWKMEIS